MTTPSYIQTMRSSSLRSLVVLALCGGGALSSLLVACSGADEDYVWIPDGGSSGARAGSRLAEATGVEWVIEKDSVTGTAAFAFPTERTPVLLGPGQEPATVASAFLATYPEIFGVAHATELQAEAAETDDDGSMHVRLVQRAGDRVVTDAVLQVHFDAEGTVTHVTGPFYPTLAAVAAQTPSVTAEAAAQSAVARVVAESGASTAVVAEPSHTEVHILDQVPVLVHVVRVSVDQVGWEVWIDAVDGSERFVDSTTRQLSVTAAGMVSSRTIEIDEPKDGVYRLTRSGTPTRSALTVIDLSTRGTFGHDELGYSTRDKGTWDRAPIDETKKGVAIEVFYKMGLADSWFRSLGWKSFDGKGGAIQVGLFDPRDSAGYAAFDGAGPSFRFSGGNAWKKAPVSMDVVAHEFTHGVFHNTTQISGTCAQEGRAIDEAFGDIFGQLVSADTVGGKTDLVGEEFGRADTIRSLSDPAQRTGDNPNVGRGADHVENKQGRCHDDAGIVNLAWYLMTHGGEHPESKRGGVKVGIGMSASKKLWWQLLRYELRGAASFQDLAKRSMLAAKSKSISQESVGCAWQAVGVLDAKTLKSNYKVECPVSDGGTPDTCSGKVDGFHCSEIDKRAAYLCKGGNNAGADYCAVSDHCSGAAGSAKLVCTKN